MELNRTSRLVVNPINQSINQYEFKPGTVEVSGSDNLILLVKTESAGVPVPDDRSLTGILQQVNNTS